MLPTNDYYMHQPCTTSLSYMHQSVFLRKKCSLYLSIVVILIKFMTNVWLHLTPSAPPEESVLEHHFWVPMTMLLIFQGCSLPMITACMNLAQLQVRSTKVCFLGRNVFSLLKHSSHLKKIHDQCMTGHTLHPLHQQRRLP